MTKSHTDRLRVLALLVLFTGIAYFYFNLFFPARIPSFLKLGITDRPMNVLVLGTDITFDVKHDKETLDVGRTDAIMILHLGPLGGKLNILSVPRDSYVEIPGFGYNKINAAYVLGGIELTKQALENLTGKSIDRYIIINTKGITKLVDLLGGVTVDVERDMYYSDSAQDLYINLKAGRQKLSGKDAEGFIRFRHDALGDLGRIQRQQQFLGALANKFASPVSFLKAPFIIGIIRDHVRSGLSLKEFIMLANTARMMPHNKIKSQTLPGESQNNQAGSVIILNQTDLRRIVGEML